MIFPTADAVTNSYCLLFIAVVLCLYQRDDMLQYWHIALLCMMGALLGQVKITCFIIALFVLFLIPKAHGCVKDHLGASCSHCFCLHVALAGEDLADSGCPESCSIGEDTRA